MLGVILVVLVILWILGYINLPNLPFSDFPLLTIAGHVITVYNVLIFVALLIVVDLLPRPFREIAGVLVILWILSFLGIIAIAGLSNLIVLAIIIGLVVYLLKGTS